VGFVGLVLAFQFDWPVGSSIVRIVLVGGAIVVGKALMIRGKGDVPNLVATS
jgi:hypothetical protein